MLMPCIETLAVLVKKDITSVEALALTDVVENQAYLLQIFLNFFTIPHIEFQWRL